MQLLQRTLFRWFRERERERERHSERESERGGTGGGERGSGACADEIPGASWLPQLFKLSAGPNWKKGPEYDLRQLDGGRRMVDL